MSIENTAPFGATPPTWKLRMESGRQLRTLLTSSIGSKRVSESEIPKGMNRNLKLKKIYLYSSPLYAVWVPCDVSSI